MRVHGESEVDESHHQDQRYRYGLFAMGSVINFAHLKSNILKQELLSLRKPTMAAKQGHDKLKTTAVAEGVTVYPDEGHRIRD